MKEIYQRKDKLQTALSFNLLFGQYHKQACDMHGYKYESVKYFKNSAGKK